LENTLTIFQPIPSHSPQQQSRLKAAR